MTTLYQKDVKGKIRVWSVQVEGSTICSISGILGGAMIPVNTEIAEGLGGKTPPEQANFDMQTEINKKIKQGYVEDLSQVKTKYETATIDKPAKGLCYHPLGKNKALKLGALKGKMVGIQAKLDGWRYRIWTDGYECIYYTSSGDVTLEFSQITECILECFPSFSKEFGVESIILDGEIYNHELGFQAVASACGTTKHITPEKQELRDQMEFHIFDIVGNWGMYPQRHAIIKQHFDNFYIRPLLTWFIQADEISIDKQFEYYLRIGYEGLIIRNLETEYEHRKSKQFLKYKPLIDDEFEVVGFEKSISGDTLGSLECKLADGRMFSTNLKNEIGTDVYKQYIWNNKEKFLGKFVTVEFLEYTDDNIPRLPRAKCFRKGQGID